ncbi:MAG: carboxypeptidase-like regulatory domain-containing protein [Dysgonamonadaceae bacterium]|jgi:hypothetical protein|nr:carboxypeptidase-like regulatory domain-containing protein [Dysgonamonadaceae bacterium]
MKKIATYLALFIVSFGNIVAQNLEGIVLDAETHGPVHNALVYLDGTSFIAATDTEGKFKLSTGNRINTRLVISHVSYERIIISEPFDELPEIIYLEKQVIQLDEITVSAVSKSRYTRNQMLKAFRQQFLGNTKAGKACKILNEDNIRLRYDAKNNALVASSLTPVEIENKYLGYKILWEIMEFEVRYKRQTLSEKLISSVSITGTASFEDIIPENRRILNRRKDTYTGSSRNFFSLVSKNRLDESTLSLFTEMGKYPASEMFTVINIPNDKTVKQIKLKPDKRDSTGITTVYVQQKSPGGNKYSRIVFSTDKFHVDLYGNTNLEKDASFLGDMSERRIGDVLPLDYKAEAESFYEPEPGPEEKIAIQLQTFPQEKIHIHTDKSVYISGDSIWYRAFVVDAHRHRPAYASRYVYVELVAPAGELISRDKIRPNDDSLFHNNIILANDMAEGTYLIRAYTNFMRNRPDYFFEKKVFVANPAVSKINAVPEFSVDEKHGAVKLNIYNDEGENAKVKYLKMRADTGEWKLLNPGRDFSFDIASEKQQFIAAEFEIEGKKHNRYIPVPKSDNDFDVSFFPEGGYLIPGEICKMGFKALKTNGLSENITGVIINSKGDTIGNIQPEHAGMGLFSFLPVQGEKYYAICRNSQGKERRFQLPDSNPEACALKVFRNKDNLYVTVLKGNEFQDRALNLVVHTRGTLIYFDRLPEQNVVIIEKDMIPVGVIQVLLLDEDMNPLSERIVFYPGEKDLAQTDFSTDKPEYTTRDHVKAQIRISDEQGNLLDGSLSVSITDDGDIKPDSSFSIVSNLLLCSDIRGYVESPEYYIQNPNNADILMLTQAWKRYDIPAVLKGSLEKPVHFPETGQEVSGRVKRIIGKKANIDNTVTLVAGSGYVSTTTTDRSGRFAFKGFEFPDSSIYAIQAFSKQGKSYVELIVDEETFPKTDAFPVPEHETGLSQNYIAKANIKHAEKYSENAILLDSVLITAVRPRPKSKYSSILSTYIFPDEYKHIPGFDFTRAIRLFPRLNVFAGKVSTAVGRGTTKKDDQSPVFIVDDWVLYEAELRDIANMDIEDIESIEFLDPNTDRHTLMTLPFEAPGGLIVITTKSKTFGKGRKIKFNIKTVMPKGYRKAAEFYSPKYKTKEDFKKKIDRRTTVFWKPNVIFENGEAQFDFYTADSKTTYSVVIEGITTEGQIVRQTGQIAVRGDYDLAQIPKTQSPKINLLEKRMQEQLNAFPQEKIHLHTDKSSYVSGEKIWYRAFVIDASRHTPSYASRYVYVELISPTGEVAVRNRIRPDEDSIFHNSILLREDLADGTYLIRAYTNFMRNRPGYMFEKKIFIADPHASEVNAIPKFTSRKNRNVINLKFTGNDGIDLNVKNLVIHTDSINWEVASAEKNFSFTPPKENMELMYIQFEVNGRKYKRYIPMPSPADDFEVSFFPEGGYLIPDRVCKIGFKALKTNGLSEDISGEIIAENGDVIISVKSGHAGMGIFSFRPEKGKKYSAICRNREGYEKRFQLPDANPEACVLKVFGDKDKVYATVLKGNEFEERALNVVVHTGGALIYAGTLPEQDTAVIDKGKISSGVSQILLLDNEMNPLSERMIFNFDDKELPATAFSTDKSEYTTKERVSTRVKIADAKGKALEGSFSVSLTDDEYVKPDSLFSIVSGLLLCSDIRGYVESPEYYIQNPDNADILMLTQAWKRYNIPAVLKDSIEKPVYLIETSQKISGRVERMIGKKANKGNAVSLTVPDYGYINTCKTDENGRFVFSKFEFPDSTMYLVQALGKSGGNYVELVIDDEIFPDVPKFTIPELEKDSLLDKYITELNVNDIEIDSTEGILLDPVVIKGRYLDKNIIYPEDFEHINNFDVTNALKFFPKLHVWGNKLSVGNWTSKVGIIVDGWALDSRADLRDIKDIDMNSIESIEFIEPPDLKYTARPTEGILIINTKSKTWGKGRRIKFNIRAWFPKGYREADEFYSPKYETGEELQNADSRRTTVFWKPNVFFENGEAEFEFYTADYETIYSVVIEGVTNDGKIVRKTDKIYLKK